MLPDHHELDYSQVMYGELLESGGDAACLLEPANTALDYVASTIRCVIKLERAATLGEPAIMPLLLRDHGLYVVIPQPKAYRGNIVALITSDHLGTRSRATAPPFRLRYLDGTQDRGSIGGFMRLTGAQLDSQGQPPAVSDQMQLGAEAAAAAPERDPRARLWADGNGADFFSAPAACLCARTLDPSIHQSVHSICPRPSSLRWSCWSIRSHSPLLVHRRKRL